MAPLHPAQALYDGGSPLPALPACEHYAGSEKLLRKSCALHALLGPLFDITADCEDGAPAGRELAHAEMLAALIAELCPPGNPIRIGLRIHDVRHPCWHDELALILSRVGERLAYLVLPKAQGVLDVQIQIAALERLRAVYGIARPIPVHVLIETHGALREVWSIATLPQVESLDFGLMDFVSAHHGAIPASAMCSPGQFEHALIARAKSKIVAAALAHGRIPTHNVSTELNDMQLVRSEALRARQQFGFLRMWSIHPAQIEAIVAAMQPDFSEIEQAASLLQAAQEADWGPIRHGGRLHDRASYRYYWDLLRRAQATGCALPAEIRQRFFT